MLVLSAFIPSPKYGHMHGGHVLITNECVAFYTLKPEHTRTNEGSMDVRLSFIQTEISMG